MQETKVEEVTRTYCDVCGKDITHKSQYGAGTNNTEHTWVVCGESKYDIELIYRKKGVTFNCEKFARLYMDYPQLANKTFYDNILKDK